MSRQRRRRKACALKRKQLIEGMMAKETQFVEAAKFTEPSSSDITSEPDKAERPKLSQVKNRLFTAANAIINKKVAANERKDV